MTELEFRAVLTERLSVLISNARVAFDYDSQAADLLNDLLDDLEALLADVAVSA